MPKHERVVLVLGETVKLSAKDLIKSDDNRLSKDVKGKWGSTSSAAVLTSDDLTKEEVTVVGSSIGKSLVFYRQDVVLTEAETIASSVGAGAPDSKREIEDKYAIAFEVEVVAPKKDSSKAKSGSAAASAATAAAPGLASSNKFDGRLPMNEVQEEPSEKTPYGTDQEGKPVAPFPGMVSPTDDSSVARQSETAESGQTNKPSTPTAASEADAKDTTAKDAAAKDAAAKSSTKKAGSKKK